jgi:hypothetical protein
MDPMLTWTDVVEMAAALPGVEESTSYGTPALKVAKKLLARYRNEADGAVVLVCDQDDKAALLAAGETGVFTEPHYDGYGSVLVNLDEVAPALVLEPLTDAWRDRAPAKLRKLVDEG